MRISVKHFLTRNHWFIIILKTDFIDCFQFYSWYFHKILLCGEDLEDSKYHMYLT